MTTHNTPTSHRQPSGAAPKQMVWIAGGSFMMGSNDFYPEERPQHAAAVDGFWIDIYLVTNAAFRRFVKATGYRTAAERPLDPADFPGADPAALVPGALVFRNPGHPVSLHDLRQWWIYMPGACWRHPEGPGSTLDGRDRHPVVHIAYEDALAYASWAGKVLPTEAEWECAARGGLAGAIYGWGDEFAPKGQLLANTWQGTFPWQNLKSDGFEGTSPTGAFPPNQYGLYDMIGNVWEWTCDRFAPHQATSAPCCTPDLRAPDPHTNHGAAELPAALPTMVIKGGSHLCAPNYCLRYRPAARQGQVVDSATSHLGFRCVLRPTS